MLVGAECSAYPNARQILGRDLPPPPLGACLIPIVEGYVELIREDMRVLEIGCGAWDRIRRHCEFVGARYDGIDTEPEYFGKKTVATRLENLSQLSFADDCFDVVIGTQTMEHWAENGCSLRWGLYQCFRVCKPRGIVLMNVPVHFHGTREFMLGKVQTLRTLFAPFSGHVVFHEWGNPSDPIPPAFPFPGYWRLRNRPAYVLDIRAIKDRPLPERCSNRGAVRGRLAQLLHYPPSYNVYRVLRKLGLFQAG